MKVNDTVRLPHLAGTCDEFARVVDIDEDGIVWVSNLNMPFSGTLAMQAIHKNFVEEINSNV